MKHVDACVATGTLCFGILITLPMGSKVKIDSSSLVLFSPLHVMILTGLGSELKLPCLSDYNTKVTDISPVLLCSLLVLYSKYLILLIPRLQPTHLVAYNCTSVYGVWQIVWQIFKPVKIKELIDRRTGFYFKRWASYDKVCYKFCSQNWLPLDFICTKRH